MKKRVLIVDDDVGVRTSMKRVLERAGYQVALAEDGPQAMAQFAPDQTDLMLLDLNLPSKSGWDVFEHLTTRNPLVPVIIITGMAGQYRTALAAGVGALIEKPVEPAGLLRTIGEVLAEADEMRLRRLCGLEGATRHVRSRHPQSPAVPHAP